MSNNIQLIWFIIKGKLRQISNLFRDKLLNIKYIIQIVFEYCIINVSLFPYYRNNKKHGKC